VRVVGGELRGRLLQSPRSSDVRPSEARLRAAVFSVLAARLGRGGRIPLEGTTVLDLYCGSGALGIEALSRGASAAVFVDRQPASVRLTRSNLAALGLQERAQVVRSAVEDFLDHAEGVGRFDLIFADPPYTVGCGALWRRLDRIRLLLRPGGLFVVQHAVQEELPPPSGNLHEAWRRSYGDSEVTLLVASEGQGGAGTRRVPDARSALSWQF